MKTRPVKKNQKSTLPFSEFRKIIFPSRKTDEEETSPSDQSSDEESEIVDHPKPHQKTVVNNNETVIEKAKTVEKSNLDLLLDFTDFDTPVMTPSLGGFLTPGVKDALPSTFEIVPALYTNTKTMDLLSKINGRGLAATYRFTRSPHILSPAMTNINVIFTNHTNDDICDLRVGKKVRFFLLKPYIFFLF